MMKSFNETEQEFLNTLDDREKLIRELYLKTNGDIVLIATQLGIPKGQADRLIKRVYFKGLEFAKQLHSS